MGKRPNKSDHSDSEKCDFWSIMACHDFAISSVLLLTTLLQTGKNNLTAVGAIIIGL